MKPGYYQNHQLPAEQYHADRGSVSQSGLKRFAQSPAHYRAYLDGLTETDTAAKFIGTAVHAAALEPEAFAEQYIVAPSKYKTGNAAGLKAWKEEQDPRLIVLLERDAENVYRMRDALHRHSWVGPQLRDAQCEYSVIADDPETGTRCRVRFDMLTGDGLILDLKKCQDARDDALRRSIFNYGYHVQNAFYMDVPSWLGDGPAGFCFVFIEEKPPHAISVRFLDPEDVERGRMEYRRLLNDFAECVKADHWPAYPEDPRMIALSGWARNQIDNGE